MKRYKVLLVIGLCSLLWAVSLRAARAADAVVGDGDPSSCTEAAFDSALATASAGGGTITFNCGPATTTIAFTVVKIANLGDVTLDGGGRIVLQAGANERHFFVGSGVTFRVQNITLRDGDSLVSGGAIELSGATVVATNVQFVANASTVNGGAIYCYDGALTIANSVLQDNSAGSNGGAIYNDGCAVTITNSTLRDNRALAAGGRGGAIDNQPAGVLNIHTTLLQGNQATDGGGVYINGGAAATFARVTFTANSGGYGGGIENSGVLTITDSLFEANTVTGSGGAFWNLGGTATIERTTFRGNRAYEGGGVNSYGNTMQLNDVNVIDNVAAGGNGGGIYHGSGTLFVTNATISGNRAEDAAGNGGGVYQNSDDNLTLTNVTLADNQAGALGGGLYHYARYAVLTNVTIADNRAGAAGDAIYEDSPMTPSNPGVVQIVNSVIVGSANNCDGGLFTSLGHNISRGTCASLNDPTDQDNVASDLLLGPLSYNGGAFAMQTRLPQAGSPLIDAADPAACFADDQRRASRVGVCDIGAVEYGAMASTLYLPTVVR
jgi:predicted outer membrane repeat protein